MNAFETVLLGCAVAGAAAAVLHMLGWVPPRYRRMLADVQHDTATALTDAVKGPFQGLGALPTAEDMSQAVYVALTRVASEQQAAFEKDATNALAQAKGSLGGAATALARGAKVDADRLGEAKDAVGSAIVGPYLPILEQFAPTLAQYLVENPDMALEVMQWPVVQKIIQMASAKLGGLTKASQSSSSAAWGLGT